MSGAVAESTVGVLDVGSFSAHLVVVDRHGSPRDPVFTHKTRLRLDRALDERGRIGAKGVASIVDAVREGARVAKERRVGELFPLATSSIRDARNARDVVAEVHRKTGVRLRFLSGRREAELSFLAARRWYGSSAGPLLVLDIGGGTVELAGGAGEQAEFARSLSLGAREVNRSWFANGSVCGKRIDEARAYTLSRVKAALTGVEPMLCDSRPVGCSKVFRQLARLAAAPSRSTGRTGATELRLDELRDWIPRLAELPPARRHELPGISRVRAPQALAGAIVAEALMTVCAKRVAICPWSTRDGLLLTLQQGNGFDLSPAWEAA